MFKSPVKCKKRVLLMVLILLFSIIPPVSAEAPYIVLFSSQEETDLKELWKKAQQSRTSACATVLPAFQEFEAEDGEITQLIEVRRYQDGSIQEDYISTSFLAMENNQTVPLTADSYLDEKQLGGYDIVTVSQVSYTADWANAGSMIEYTYRYIRGKLTQKSGTKTVRVDLGFEYLVSLDTQEYEVMHTVTTNASAGVWYAWDFGANGMVLTVENATGGCGAFCEYIVSGATGGGTLAWAFTLQKPKYVIFQ